MFTGRVIYNPAAGRLATEVMIHQAAQELERSGWQVEVLASHSGEHTAQLAQQAAEDGLDAVFVAGGDGSIRWALEGLLGPLNVGLRTALGVLPAGTSNVWARELGLPRLTWFHRRALRQSAAALANGLVHAMDVGLVAGRPFLQWAGVGLDSEVVNYMESKRVGRRRFSTPKYVAAALSQARTWKGLDLRIDVGDETFEGHFLLVVIANIRGYAGGLATISPQACLDDGEMDLWLFTGNSIQRAIGHAWRLLAGQHIHSAGVKSVRFNQLKLHAQQPLVFQLDGDPFAFEQELNIEVRPQAQRVVVPAYIPDSLFALPGVPLVQ